MLRRRLAPLAGIAALALAAFLLLRSDKKPADPGDVGVEPKAASNHRETTKALEPPKPSGEREQHAASKAAGPKTLAQGHAVLKAKWGGKPGELGRRPADESNPEAPMSIIAGPGDELIIVDQANLRVQRFEHGKAVASFPASETVQDVARLPGGKTVLLDRLADKNIQIYGPDGQLKNTIPIVGKGIAEGGSVTGVFADDKGVYVEKDHNALVRVADADGNQDHERTELPGRPTRDGKLMVSLGLTNQGRGDFVLTAFDRNTFTPVWSQDLSMGLPVLHVVTVDSDTAGNVYVAADTGREASTPPYPIVDESITVLRIGAGGITGRLELPFQPTGDEMQRPITIGEDGTVYMMVPGADGMSIMRYNF